MNLKHFSNQCLLENTKKLSIEERGITTKVLHHLKEIEFRKLHLELAYSSLFEYAVKELGYSEDAAYRRINAMRLIKNLPEVEAKIIDGTLSLTNAAKIQSFMKNHKKISKESSLPIKLETKQDKLEWIETLANKSTREVEKEIFKLCPEAIPHERIRQISGEKIELKLIIDEGLKNQLDQLKNFLSHKNPNMNYQELIRYLAQMGLQKLDPTLKKQRNVSGAPRLIFEIANDFTKKSGSPGREAWV